MKLRSLILIIIIPFSVSVAQQNGWIKIDSLKEARVGHAIVVLPNGNILVSGGEGGSPNSRKSSAEIFDFIEKKWRYTKPMNVKRVSHNMVLLKSGKVLAIGGYKERSCELFDPITETWSLTDSIPTLRFAGHTVTELKDGSVLVSGGYKVSEYYTQFEYLHNCEIYNPYVGKWDTTHSLNIGRYNHTTVLLSDGRVLIAGGTSKTAGSLNTTEVFDVSSKSWTVVSSMNESRSKAASILLPDGNVFVSGGDSLSIGNISTKNSSEIFDFGKRIWSRSANMINRRSGHIMYFSHKKDKLLIFGGAGFQSTLEDTWESYDPVTFKPIAKGIFPLKISVDKNTVQLIDSKIALLGGQEFDIINGLPTSWPSRVCYIFDLVTSVKISKQIPIEHKLYQNYPNPFNPKTRIGFYLPENKHVKLEIYDSVGKFVTMLVNGFENQGYHEVEFDAKGLASGIYFYKMISGNYILSKKMIILK
jgi:hypothetical protein